MRASTGTFQIPHAAASWPWRPVASPAVGILRLLGERIGGVIRRWRERSQARQEREALLSMSDHVLQDIGLTRYEVFAAHIHNRPLRRTES